MSDTMDLLKTPLHEWHLDNHANMAEFGGYHMPLWYPAGAKEEHRAVISAAGLFDTSHMAVLTVTGREGFSLLQHCFSKDLNHCLGRPAGPLREGRSSYGLFLRPDGTVLDDAIVSMLGRERFMVVVNSGMGALVAEHLRSQGMGDAVVVDYTDKIGKIDLQGPAAAVILEKVLEQADQVLGNMVYFSFKGDIFPGAEAAVSLKDGTRLLLSRTGYTGEFGFELFVAAADTASVWQALLDAGTTCGAVPCGLAARDSLRAGALLPLSHQDIGSWVFSSTPWEFVLPWDEGEEGFTKSFIGSEAVLAGRADSYTYGFAGFDPRKIPVSDETSVLDGSGAAIGSVLTCTTDMAIDRVGERIVSLATPVSAGRPADFRARGLCCGFIRAQRPCKVGEMLRLTQGKREIKVEVRDDVRPDRSARRSMREMRRTN